MALIVSVSCAMVWLLGGSYACLLASGTLMSRAYCAAHGCPCVNATVTWKRLQSPVRWCQTFARCLLRHVQPKLSLCRIVQIAVGSECGVATVQIVASAE